MNLNNTCDYIDATNSYPIIDYIDEQIENNNIYITSNTYSCNVKLNNNQSLDNSLYYIGASNLNQPTNHLILSNNYNFGEIKFSTYFKYANSNQIGTKIDYTGKLFLYHNYNLIQPSIFEGYYDMDYEIAQLKTDGLATDVQLTVIEAAIITINQDVVAINGELITINGSVILINENILLLQKEIDYIAGPALVQRTQILESSQTIGEALSSFGQFLVRDRNINTNILNTSLQYGVAAAGLGAVGAIFGFLYNDRMSNMANNVTSSNFVMTQGDRSNLIYQSDSQNALYANEYISGTCNLGLYHGFINSNIITTQYINSINTNEIKMNNLNFSNIFVTSNVLNTTSNILSNYTFNSSNLNFNYTFDSSNILNNKINNNSNVITYNNSNLLFNTNYTVERPYPPKLYNSSTSQSVVTYLNQNPTYYETFTLTTADITYGSGTYEVRSSSIDDTTISFTGTGSTLNTVTGNSNYNYISFINNGTLTLNSSLNCDILVVGGGGSGGGQIAGGGGGGAVVYITNATISSGSYNIVVGAGGIQTTTSGDGNKGNNSSFAGIIAEGGGRGGRFGTNNSSVGGSGGGADADLVDGTPYPIGASVGTSSTLNGYSGTIYGNKGGDGLTRSGAFLGGGGGGGAGEIGINGNPSFNGTGGRGGNGIQINITGTNLYWGAGGGAAQYNSTDGGVSSRGGNGGLGGGGGGASAQNYPGVGGTGGLNNGTNATAPAGGDGGANTGSGGGGGGWVGSIGGAGGSGIVIIRFLNPTITTKKELFNLITNDSGSSFKTNQYDITNGNYLTTNRYINNYYGDWIIIKKPNPIYLIKYQIYNRPSFIERAPSLFKIFGSTDGITYDEITEASNTTPLTTSNYSSGYFEKIVNYYSKAYSYFALVVNKIIGGNINSHMLNFTEFKIFGKEFINYTPIYASSNAVKQIIIYDTPTVNKKKAFYCTTTNVIYPNGGNTPYYAYHIDLRNYTQTGYIDIGSGSGDPYRIFTIKCFFGSSYFQSLINGIPDIVDYTVYMSYKANSGGSNTKQGLNIMATGIPQCYYLDTITPNRIFLLRNVSNDFNYISVVTTSSADVRVFIECLLS